MCNMVFVRVIEDDPIWQVLRNEHVLSRDLVAKAEDFERFQCLRRDVSESAARGSCASDSLNLRRRLSLACKQSSVYRFEEALKKSAEARTPDEASELQRFNYSIRSATAWGSKGTDCRDLVVTRENGEFVIREPTGKVVGGQPRR
ncbi:hypothetical protein PENDEC_c021G01117 [Penicillium decumbens]|uniref:Uncharacterized protein n=1 Tax=Penicillium decumbens TaxID=69771 RepID=A0A1V6P657_PENDC|nr:hypothetical protein PENDEC_c021G01117 [Penicillium decumbens]